VGANPAGVPRGGAFCGRTDLGCQNTVTPHLCCEGLKCRVSGLVLAGRTRCSPRRTVGRTLLGRLSGRAPRDSPAQTRSSRPTARERPNCRACPPRLRPLSTPDAPAAPRAARLPHTVPKIRWAYPIVFRGSDPPPAARNPKRQPSQPDQPQPQTRVPAGEHRVMRGPLRGADLGRNTQWTCPTGLSVSDRPQLPHGPRTGEAVDPVVGNFLESRISGFCKATIYMSFF
jgi:hypothetical protein